MTDKEIKEGLLKIRDEYINIIKAEMIGPGSEFDLPDKEHELISSSPVSRYSAGILFPQGNKNKQDNDETVEIETENVGIGINMENEGVSEIIENKQDKREFVSSDLGEENLDEQIEMASQFKQSSMGLTFMINEDINDINIGISFALYHRALISQCLVPYNVDNPEKYKVPEILSSIITYNSEHKAISLLRKVKYSEIREIKEKDILPDEEAYDLERILYKLASYCNNGYIREPFENIPVHFIFGENDYVEAEYNEKIIDTPVKLVARKTKIRECCYAITIMMVNKFEDVLPKAEKCIFQARIDIRTNENKFKIIESKPVNNIELDEEEQSLELLYRNKKNYAKGLGVSTNWNIDNNGKGSIWTDFFPVKEIPSMDFNLPDNSLISQEELSMKYYSDLNGISREEKINSLRKLVDTYSLWIESIEKIADTLENKYKKAAWNNIEECKKAKDRMYAGINILLEDNNAYDAFVLANRAMFMQRVQMDMQRINPDVERFPENEEVAELLDEMNYYEKDDNKCRWRPFQLAFLIMDIKSITDEESKDREIVDLIWFPTGGGKTEAYLGLTAFTIFFRKLSYLDKSNGTAVIMRYTLRLLASQQFTRAATLICACEYIRKDCQKKKSKYPKYELGKDEITIGLWIGGNHIPNKNEGKRSAKENLDKLRASGASTLKYNKEKYNKFQVLKCPWCGTKMVKETRKNKIKGDWGYNMKNEKHFYMHCPQEECDFTNKLPIQIIDEELYSNPPTLLFGTVDKFAMMPWNENVGNFFACNSENRTPELIIQDELHLISGSLGTMVGLYETAIDNLCSMKNIKPKVIASTATIRRAKEQCSVLYNREVTQFPAPGIDSSDSFFSRETVIDYSNLNYGRKYVGIMPSGKTKAMTEIRMIASMLERTILMDVPEDVKDKIWTLTVYFNSLKELGKASTMVEDDVKDFIIRIANRLLKNKRIVISPDELTSRVSTTELNETLDKLEKIKYSKENRDNKMYASDVLLATNMISVGIDIARLNTMLMIGQPKLTSEYIQASSRVGRNYPGVVFVQYDATKSRDRSHYESFKSYHESYYKYVEPTGATPFSKPARERALHAVLLSILRQQLLLLDDKSAGLFNKSAMEEVIKNAENYILERIKQIDKRSSNIVTDYNAVLEEMNEFIDFWQELADECNGDENKELYFGKRFMVSSPDGEKERRLIKQYNAEGKDYAKETLTSMRNVDSTVNGEIIIWKD